MDDACRAALRSALDVVHVPSRARLMRQAPLPAGLLILLEIASGDQQALAIAVQSTGRQSEVVARAARFFIEQILLDSSADSYRVLGGDKSTPLPDLRRNMALLAKALHPDLMENKDRSVFAGRVTQAWDNLKTPERRAGYDRSKLLVAGKTGSARRAGARAGVFQLGFGGRDNQRPHRDAGAKSGPFQRLMAALFGWVRS